MFYILVTKYQEIYQQRDTNWIRFDIETFFIEVRDKRTENIISEKLWKLLDLKTLILLLLRNGDIFEFRNSNQTNLYYNFCLRM